MIVPRRLFNRWRYRDWMVVTSERTPGLTNIKLGSLCEINQRQAKITNIHFTGNVRCCTTPQGGPGRVSPVVGGLYLRDGGGKLRRMNDPAK